jgi:hypothetical protein
MLPKNVAKSEKTLHDEEKKLQGILGTQANAIFGDDVVYICLSQRYSGQNNFIHIPNGFIIGLREPIWCLVTLGSVPGSLRLKNLRLNRFCSIIKNPSAQRKLVSTLLNEITQNTTLSDYIKNRIFPIEIQEYLLHLVSNPPQILSIIDERSNEIREVGIGLKTAPSVLGFRTIVGKDAGDSQTYLLEPIPVCSF